MNIKRTISLLLLLQQLLCGNSVAMDRTSFLIKKLKKVGAWYDPEPALRASLDEAVVTQTVFWKKIKKNIQKNEALSEQDKKKIEKICENINNNDGTRHVQRFNLAAALYLGIDSKYNTWMQEALCGFVLCGDYPLVALMLEKGCDPNTIDFFGDRVIFNARTVAMAELLRSHGANLNVTTFDLDTLLHDIFTKFKTYELIPYYIKYGVDPMQQNNSGETALEQGITYHMCEEAPLNIINRVAAFLEAGVSEDDILAVGQVHQEYQPFVTQALELYYKNK